MHRHRTHTHTHTRRTHSAGAANARTREFQSLPNINEMEEAKLCDGNPYWQTANVFAAQLEFPAAVSPFSTYKLAH